MKYFKNLFLWFVQVDFTRIWVQPYEGRSEDFSQRGGGREFFSTRTFSGIMNKSKLSEFIKFIINKVYLLLAGAATGVQSEGGETL